VVQIGGIAPHLAQEADFIVGELRQPLMAIAVAIGKELRQRQIHCPGDLGQRIQRWDGVAVFNPRQVAAQQARALFDVALGHASLEPEIADGLADIHRRATNSMPRLNGNLKDACIVTRVVPSGKWKFLAFSLALVSRMVPGKGTASATPLKAAEIRALARDGTFPES